MKKSMFILTIIAIVAAVFTGCTMQGDKLDDSQNAIIATSLNGITHYAINNAKTDLTNARLAVSDKTVLGSDANLESSTTILTNKITVELGDPSTLSIEQIVSFNNAKFDILTTPTLSQAPRWVTVTLYGNYRVFFEIERPKAGGYVAKVNFKEYNYRKVNGLKAKFSSKIPGQFKDFESWININMDLTVKPSKILEIADVTEAKGSINGAELSKEMVKSFDYKQFSQLSPFKPLNY